MRVVWWRGAPGGRGCRIGRCRYQQQRGCAASAKNQLEGVHNARIMPMCVCAPLPKVETPRVGFPLTASPQDPAACLPCTRFCAPRRRRSLLWCELTFLRVAVVKGGYLLYCHPTALASPKSGLSWPASPAWAAMGREVAGAVRQAARGGQNGASASRIVHPALNPCSPRRVLRVVAVCAHI